RGVLRMLNGSGARIGPRPRGRGVLRMLNGSGARIGPRPRGRGVLRMLNGSVARIGPRPRGRGVLRMLNGSGARIAPASAGEGGFAHAERQRRQDSPCLSGGGLGGSPGHRLRANASAAPCYGEYARRVGGPSTWSGHGAVASTQKSWVDGERAGDRYMNWPSSFATTLPR